MSLSHALCVAALLATQRPAAAQFDGAVEAVEAASLETGLYHNVQLGEWTGLVQSALESHPLAAFELPTEVANVLADPKVPPYVKLGLLRPALHQIQEELGISAARLADEEKPDMPGLFALAASAVPKDILGRLRAREAQADALLRPHIDYPQRAQLAELIAGMHELRRSYGAWLSPAEAAEARAIYERSTAKALQIAREIDGLGHERTIQDIRENIMPREARVRALLETMGFQEQGDGRFTHPRYSDAIAVRRGRGKEIARETQDGILKALEALYPEALKKTGGEQPEMSVPKEAGPEILPEDLAAYLTPGATRRPLAHASRRRANKAALDEAVVSRAPEMPQPPAPAQPHGGLPTPAKQPPIPAAKPAAQEEARTAVRALNSDLSKGFAEADKAMRTARRMVDARLENPDRAVQKERLIPVLQEEGFIDGLSGLILRDAHPLAKEALELLLRINELADFEGGQAQFEAELRLKLGDIALADAKPELMGRKLAQMTSLLKAAERAYRRGFYEEQNLRVALDPAQARRAIAAVLRQTEDAQALEHAAERESSARNAAQQMHRRYFGSSAAAPRRPLASSVINAPETLRLEPIVSPYPLTQDVLNAALEDLLRKAHPTAEDDQQVLQLQALRDALAQPNAQPDLRSDINKLRRLLRRGDAWARRVLRVVRSLIEGSEPPTEILDQTGFTEALARLARRGGALGRQAAGLLARLHGPDAREQSWPAAPPSLPTRPAQEVSAQAAHAEESLAQALRRIFFGNVLSPGEESSFQKLAEARSGAQRREALVQILHAYHGHRPSPTNANIALLWRLALMGGRPSWRALQVLDEMIDQRNLAMVGMIQDSSLLSEAEFLAQSIDWRKRRQAESLLRHYRLLAIEEAGRTAFESDLRQRLRDAARTLSRRGLSVPERLRLLNELEALLRRARQDYRIFYLRNGQRYSKMAEVFGQDQQQAYNEAWFALLESSRIARTLVRLTEGQSVDPAVRTQALKLLIRVKGASPAKPSRPPSLGTRPTSASTKTLGARERRATKAKGLARHLSLDNVHELLELIPLVRMDEAEDLLYTVCRLAFDGGAETRRAAVLAAEALIRRAGPLQAERTALWDWMASQPDPTEETFEILQRLRDQGLAKSNTWSEDVRHLPPYDKDQKIYPGMTNTLGGSSWSDAHDEGSSEVWTLFQRDPPPPTVGAMFKAELRINQALASFDGSRVSSPDKLKSIAASVREAGLLSAAVSASALDDDEGRAARSLLNAYRGLQGVIHLQSIAIFFAESSMLENPIPVVEDELVKLEQCLRDISLARVPAAAGRAAAPRGPLHNALRNWAAEHPSPRVRQRALRVLSLFFVP